MKPLQVLRAVLYYCDYLCGALGRLFTERETTSNEVQHSTESSGGDGGYEDRPSTLPEGETGGRVVRRTQTFPHGGHRTDYLKQSVNVRRVLSETFGGQRTSRRSREAERAEQKDSDQYSFSEDTYK